MKVQELMARDVSSCRADDSLSAAVRLMWERDVGFVPVVDGQGRIAGVVTDRDACMAAYTQGLPLSQIRVERAMAKDVFSVTPDTELERAEEIMRSCQIRRMPVVGEGDRLVGVLSINDLAVRATESAGRQGQALRTHLAETLGAVSRHRQPDRTGAASNGSHEGNGGSNAGGI